MSPTELAGIVALAVVVVREAFAMVRWQQTRRNNHQGKGNPGHSSPETEARLDGIVGHLVAIDAELLRIRDRQQILSDDVAIIKGRCDLLFARQTDHP